MFQLIWRVCTFQAKLEEVPSSIPLLIGKTIVNLCVLVFIVSMATSSVTTALWRSLLFVGLIAVYSKALLHCYGSSERFVQLLSALLATMAMILVPLAIPYVIIMFLLADVSSNTLYFMGLTASSALLLIASCWLYVVFARIYRHALNISINLALVYSLVLFLVCGLVFYLL